jgi:oligoribonuclease
MPKPKSPARPGARPVVRAQSATNLVWLDLEMTGLDSHHDAILQAALVVTDAELKPLEEYVCDIWQPERELDKLTPFVRDMHDKNGLLDRVRASKVDLAAAEKQLLERVAGWCPYGAVLCGNSVGQDKRFVDRHMPGLSRYLGYRILDVSSFKILARLWYGESAVYVKPAAGEHDALVDIRNSIAELAHYRRTLLRR